MSKSEERRQQLQRCRFGLDDDDDNNKMNPKA
jgi:hypothetical protein